MLLNQRAIHSKKVREKKEREYTLNKDNRGTMTTETFDKRASRVKNTLAEYKGVPEVEKVKEGFLTSDQIKTNILTDMRSFVKQLESLRAGAKNRRCVDMSLAQFAKRKYGFSFDERTGSPEGFLQAIGVDPSMHTLESLSCMTDFNAVTNGSSLKLTDKCS